MDPTLAPINPEGIPEWIYWVATFIGTVIGAVILRVGYKGSLVGEKKAVVTGSSDPYIDKIGVLVDPKAVELLAGSIEGHTMEMVTSRRMLIEKSDAQIRIGGKLIEELEELRRELRDLSHAVRARGHGA